jgi:hypothetical protein
MIGEQLMADAQKPDGSDATTVRRVVVRYRTKPERADENQKLVEAVFGALAQQRPAGLRYATFRLADGVSFVHVASVETDDGSNPLEAVEEFASFGRDVADRCDEPPVVQAATLVGSYRAFESAGR